MLILDLKEVLQDQVCIFEGIYFESFQIHHLTIMCRFEHTDHDILLIDLFQNFFKLFLLVHNLHD